MPSSPGTVLVLLLIAAPLAATDYYVSPAPTGSNSNAGTSSGAPVATIANALTKAVNNGDRILLERGRTFRETFTLPANRTLASYGSGALPVITASETVTVSGGGAIKTATVASQVRALWADGVFLPLARYPNSGWLACDAGSTSGLLRDSGAGGHAANRWTGAQVRWRRWSWWWETRPVTADDGAGNLSVGGTAQVDAGLVGIGSGYFIDNDLDELDSDGEWFSSATTLSVRPPPGTVTLEMVRSTTGVSANGGTIDGVAFRRFGGTALSVNGSATIRNCEFREIETDAISLGWNSGGSVVTGCTFRDVRNIAVAVNQDRAGAAGTVIERSRFERIGMQYGYGGSGSWHASGIVIPNVAGITIRLNHFIEIGYCGVILGVDNQTVERNIFVRCMGSLNDGAAVYANCNGSVIRENIILDTIGNLSTSHPWTPLGHGIWIEFLDDFHDSVISDNTSYGNQGNGVFLPNNYTTTVNGNVCLDNRNAGLLLSSEAGKPTSQNHGIAGNLLGVVAPTRRQSWSENLESWGNPTTAALNYQTGIDYGTMSGTTFVVPAGERLARTSGGTTQTLGQWQSGNANWADAGAVLETRNPILLFNDSEVTANISVPSGTWTLPNSTTAVGAAVSVAPFRSVVLVPLGTTTTPASPPYYAASGTNYRLPLTAPVPATAPTITLDPVDRTVTAPAAVGMTVAATGTSPLTYLWERQPAAGGAWTTVTGATGPVIGTATTIADDGASYRCTVSNSAGSAISSAAVLTVLPPLASGGGDGGGSGGGGCGLGSGLAALALALALGLRRALR